MKRHLSKTVIALISMLGAQAALAQTPENVPSHLVVANGSSPALAGDSKGVAHVVFEAKAAGAKVTDIFQTSSSDDGKTWTAPSQISFTRGDSTEPSIAVESTGSLDVVWTDNSNDPQAPEIFFARSTDDGKTWTQAKDISNTPGKSSSAKIVVDKNNGLHAVWCDTSTGKKNQDIYYSSSTDAGEHWGKDPLLPAVDISSTSGFSSEPSLAVDRSGGVHVAWADTTSGEDHPDIFYSRSDGTASAVWTKPFDASHSKHKSTHPSITRTGGKTYLCWSDNSRKELAADIWLDIADRSDNRFGKPINVSNTLGVSSQPEAQSNASGWLAIVWSDQTTGPDKAHIFARVSLDKGDDFSNVLDISVEEGMCLHPKVALIGKRMIVVWQEHTAAQERLKATSLKIDDIATGPAMLVDPTIRGVTGNMH